MRDPNRIKEILLTLEDGWNKVPDWRFGQLIDNFFSWVISKRKIDIWFIEDNEWLKLIKEYFTIYGGKHD